MAGRCRGYNRGMGERLNKFVATLVAGIGGLFHHDTEPERTAQRVSTPYPNEMREQEVRVALVDPPRIAVGTPERMPVGRQVYDSAPQVHPDMGGYSQVWGPSLPLLAALSLAGHR